MATSASAIPADTAPIPPEPVRAMPWKALMMPITVPNRPMKGVMVAMVASEPMPRLMSEVVSSVARSTARVAASTTSTSDSGLVWLSNWKDCRPAETTRARWLWGYFMAASIAAWGRSFFRCSVAWRANRRDCLRALLKTISSLDGDVERPDGQDDENDDDPLVEDGHLFPEDKRIQIHALLLFSKT